MNNFKRLDFIFIFLAAVIGGLMLFFPIHYMLFVFIIVPVIVFLIAKPHYCYYAIVLSIPLVRPNIHYIHLQDVLIYLCLIGAFLNSKREEKVNLVTTINVWVIAILILFLIKGFTALDLPRGMLYSIRFFEAVSLFYLTVYFIRARQVSISMIIKLLLFTSLFQASLGVVQSLTNKFGVQDYCTNRGYFGYLGLGSTYICSGRGTFWHFAPFGHYLTIILLFFLPIYHYCIKNKAIGKVIIGILFAGILFSYSRGALSGLILGYLYYLFYVEKNKINFFKKLGFVTLIIMPFVVYFLSSGYLDTLNPRNSIWDVHFAYLQDNPLHLWFGTGFESRIYGYFQYVPGNVPLDKYLNYNAHNLYLIFIEELGIIGAIIYFAFLLKIFRDTFFRIAKGSKLSRALNLSLHLTLFFIFYGGLNDHAFHHPYMQIFLMLMLGIVYAKNKKLDTKTA
ncbi:MAG: hypothetical protein ACD_20C00087G0004 [uncultured bacterium]|nr:MAG: hypothetical protein ACD_20C00087G0004 [uncultured bacterium]